METTAAFESLPGNCSYRLDRPQLRLTSGPEMDRLHSHCLIMHQPRSRALLTESCGLTYISQRYIFTRHVLDHPRHPGPPRSPAVLRLRHEAGRRPLDEIL